MTRPEGPALYSVEGRACMDISSNRGRTCAPSDSLRVSKIYHGEDEDGDFANREASGSVLSPSEHC